MKRLGLIACTAVLVSSAAVAEDWDMPTPYPDQTFHTVNITEFAKEISEATDGELNITVHSAGSLIKHAEIKNAVRGEQVQIGEFFLSSLTNENAAYGVDSLPFLATSYERAAKLWEAQKPVITQLLKRQKLIPLFSVPWPPQGLYTENEIQEVDDLKGLKFRAYNVALEEFATLAGAAPTQVEAADIPQAFSTGQVEAMITSPSTGANTKAWDFVSHYSPINAWIPKNIVVVNKDAFDALSDDVKTIVLQAAASAETRGWEMSQQETVTKTAELTENDMIVVEPSEELLSGLKDIGVEMQESWQASASEDAKSILDTFGK